MSRRYALWGGGPRYVQVGSAQDRVIKARRARRYVVVHFRLEGVREFQRALRHLGRAAQRVNRAASDLRVVQSNRAQS